MGFGAARPLAAQDKPAVVDIVPATAVQNKPAAADAAKLPDFSKEALVFDKLATRIREEADGTGTRQTTARIRILADAGVKAMAVLQFTYTASNQTVDIGYVRVVKPDGTVVLTPAYNVQDLPADVTRTAPMYSDIHDKHVAVKGLGVGDTLEYQFTLTTLRPEVPGHFWLEYSFQKDLITLDEQVDLDLPAEKSVTVASAADGPQPAISTSGGRKLYHWTSSNLARPDPDATPKSTKHWKPSIQATTFSSWEQVGAWYQSLQAQSVAVTPAIQAKADALTKGITGDEDKVRAIFNDVALHIHYVGLEFGIGRYQPHAADDVLSNEYGDCKDKHTLLAAELKAVGIEAWPVLISSGRELDSATPSPAQFDHVITLVTLGGKMMWMDSTEEVAPIGVLMAGLRDKQALAVPSGSTAYLERTPSELPFQQSGIFRTQGKLNAQGQFTGHISQSYRGDTELMLRAVLREIPPSQMKEAMQRFSQAIGFGGEVSNPQVSDVEQTGKPLEFSYDYTREKFGEWDSHRIFPAMPPTGVALMPGIKEKKPADDVDLGSPGVQDFTSSLELPKGWSLVPPSGVDLNEDWAEYKSTYAFKDGVYSAERQLTIKTTKLPLEKWDKYLAFRRSVYADEVNTTMIFNGPPIAGANFSSAEAFAGPLPVYRTGGGRGLNAELRQQIMDVLQPTRDAAAILDGDVPPDAGDVAKAETLARQAVSAVETKTGTLDASSLDSLYWMQGLSNAWSELGWSAYKSKDLTTAESYLRSAWRVSQDRQSGYRLGSVLEAKGDKQAAAHQYELAHITSISGTFGKPSFMDPGIDQQLDDAYKRVTGHQLNATALNNGQYNGSLRAELDKQLEVHGIVHTTKLNGTAFFVFAFEAGKPVRATMVGGDKPLGLLTATLQAHPFPATLPTGSKAVLLREARVICSQWAGCDADFFAPTSITAPPVLISPQDRGKPISIEVNAPPKSN